MKFIAVLFITAAVGSKLALANDYCYMNDPFHTQKSLQGTITAYQYSRGDIGDTHITPGCTATKIISLNRHGTRFAQDGQAINMQTLGTHRDQILENYLNGLGTMCASDIEALRNWAPHPGSEPENNMELTESGWDELFQNAQVLKSKFPTLIPSVYNEQHFWFQHTKTARTRDSFISYARGLFGPNAETFVKVPEAIEDDPLLYFFECPDLMDILMNAYMPGGAVYNLTKSAEAQQIVMDVSSRLGYHTPLSYETITAMNDACTYEQAWKPYESSPWCSAFKPEHMIYFEFEQEILFDFFSGKSGPYSRTAPCNLVKMLLNELGNISQKKAMFYFAHDATLNMFLNALDLIDYGELKIENFEALRDREWPISKRLPFGMNVVAVRYDCPNEVQPIKFKLFINERPAKIRGCANHLCDYKDLVQTFGKYLCVDCDKIRCKGGDF